MVKHWSDVQEIGLKDAVDAVRLLNNLGAIEALVRLLVTRTPPRVSYQYSCSACGGVCQPERASEEVSYCPQCYNYNLTYVVRVGQAQRNNNSPPVTLPQKINDLRAKLGEMLGYYFRRSRTSPVAFDCGFCPNGNCFAKFGCGEKVESHSPKTAVLKSALLTPFLWDLEFNWSEYLGSNHSITPTMLFHLLSGARR